MDPVTWIEGTSSSASGIQTNMHTHTHSYCHNCQGSPLQSSSAKEVVEKLLSANLVPSVVKLACKPTHFSQKWQLADLEVLWHTRYAV